MSPCQWEFVWFFLGGFPPHGTAGETIRPLYSRKVCVRARAIKCSALCPCSIPWRRSFDDYISSQILGDARRIDRQLGNHVRDLCLLVSNWCLLFRRVLQICGPHACSFEPCKKSHAREPNMHEGFGAYGPGRRKSRLRSLYTHDYCRVLSLGWLICPKRHVARINNLQNLLHRCACRMLPTSHDDAHS
jgi:hypothetical protein